MSKVHTLIAALALTLTVPATAAAQRRVPDAGMVAIGGEFGVFAPSDDQFEPAPIFGGLFEVYATPRLGLRGSLAYTNPAFDRGQDDTLEQFRAGFDAIYNWEGGKVHPFAGGGLGLHILQVEDEGHPVTDEETQVGFSVLGGVEYFLNRHWTIKGEGRYQWVDDVFGTDSDGFAATFGVKRYF